MTPDDSPSTATPQERAEELARLLRRADGVNTVSDSADDGGAIVMCYVRRDHADEMEDLATNSGFNVAHTHSSGDERYYVFGYDSG